MKKLILLLTILAFCFTPVMAEITIEGAVEFGTGWVNAEGPTDSDIEAFEEMIEADDYTGDEAEDAEEMLELAEEANAVQNKLDAIELEFASQIDDFTKVKVAVEVDESVLTVEEAYVKSDITGALGLELPVGFTVKAGPFKEETEDFNVLTVAEEYFTTEQELEADPEDEDAIVYSFRFSFDAVPGLEVIYATDFDGIIADAGDDAGKALDPLFLANIIYEKDALAAELWFVNQVGENDDDDVVATSYSDTGLMGLAANYKVEIDDMSDVVFGFSYIKTEEDVDDGDADAWHTVSAKYSTDKLSVAAGMTGDSEDSLDIIAADVTYSLSETTDLVGVVVYDMEIDTDDNDKLENLVGIELALVNKIGAAKWTVGYIITDSYDADGVALLEQNYKSEMSFIDEPQDNAFYIACEIEF